MRSLGERANLASPIAATHELASRNQVCRLIYAQCKGDKKCYWVDVDDPLLLQYHDGEWGVPVHNYPKHFEVLVFYGAQAGLNWSLVLKKREGYRRAFEKFDPEKITHYAEREIQKLTSDAEIILQPDED